MVKQIHLLMCYHRFMLLFSGADPGFPIGSANPFWGVNI